MGASLFDSIGLIDNLDDPIPFFNRKPVLYTFVIICLLITTICTFSRLYVRYFVTRCPGIDDIFVVLLFISTWVASIGTFVLIDHGLGQHFVMLGEEGIVKFVKTYYWVNADYILALTFVKLALLTQYLRLFDEHAHVASTRKLRRLTVGLITITSMWGVAYGFLSWVPCVPISGLWNSSLEAVRYGYGSQDITIFVGTYISHATLNMALDIAVLAIPMSTWHMWNNNEVEKKSRTALIGLYVLGGIATLCSISRFVIVVDNRATTYPEFDPTWYGGTAIALSVLEVNIATIVAALPVFWPLLRRNLDRIFVTHEVEVKVTSSEGFSQIDNDSDVKRQTHWPADDNNASSARPGGIGRSNTSNSLGGASNSGNNFEVVVMKDLKTVADSHSDFTGRSRSATSTTVAAVRAGEDTFDSSSSGLPFDGRRSNSRANSSRQHNRLNSSHSVSSQSKEILLRR